MGLYLGGSKKLKLNFSDNNKTYRINIPNFHIGNRVKLFTSEGYELKDYNDLFLTVKESE